MIKIYSSEAQAGLGEQISNNTIAYTVPVSTHVPTTREKQIAKLFTTDAIDAKKSVEQFDLYYINSVLVSTGWNKNDDVFDTKERIEIHPSHHYTIIKESFYKSKFHI